MTLRRLALWAALACAPTLARPAAAASEGLVSWYGSESGARTANGEPFRPDGLTCAHRSLPFGTRVRVTDLATRRSVICRVNDRGPARRLGRTLDLARGAARALGTLGRGVIRARIAVVGVEDEGL